MLLAPLALALFSPVASPVQGASQDQVLTAPVPLGNAEFGRDVAGFGDELAVWSGGDTDYGVSIWKRGAGGTWTFDQKVRPSFTESQFLPFWTRLDFQGDRIVVPADRSGLDVTAVLERGSDGTWAEVAELTTLTTEFFDVTHNEATVFGDRVAVGVQSLQGSRIRIFERDASGNWTEVDEFTLETGITAVDSGDDLIAVATRPSFEGRITIMEREASGAWVELDFLEAPDGSDGSRFGNYMELDGDRLIASLGDVNDGSVAAVYERDATGHFALAGVLGTADGSQFVSGGEVQIEADRAIAAEPFGEGRILIFEPSPTGEWVQRMSLRAEVQELSVNLGGRIALGEGWAVGGMPDYTPVGGPEGSGAAFSFDLGELYRKGTKLSVGSGGVQELYLRPDLAFASQAFAVAGSLSGTGPGVDLGGGLLLPLALDNYLVSSFANLGTPQSLVKPSLAFLTSEASANVDLVLPAGLSPSLVGLTAHHAFVTFDPGGQPSSVSNAVPVLLTP